MTTPQTVIEERWTPTGATLPPVGKVVTLAYFNPGHAATLSVGRLTYSAGGAPVWKLGASEARLPGSPDAWQPIPERPRVGLRQRLAWLLDRWGWRLVKLSKRLEG